MTGCYLLLFLFLDGGLGNPIQVTLAALRDAPAALLLIDLDNSNLLQRLQNLAVNVARGIDVVRGARAAVLGRAVHPAETANADGLAQVDVPGDGSGADVEPSQESDICCFLSPARILRSYQSGSWGGSSLECEVLTVSTHPSSQVRAIRQTGESLQFEHQRTWNRQLALTLQEGGVSRNELLSL